MPRWFAFLRAVNVGGRVVKKDDLRAIFTAAGGRDIETFLASGNVVFSAAGAEGALQRRVERALAASLGYDVPTPLRGEAEMTALARRRPFPPARVAAAHNLYVGFLGAPPDAAATARVLALASDVDTLVVDGRELWWLLAVPQTETKLTNVKLERALGQPVTFRGVSTIDRLAAKFLGGAA